MAPLTLTEAAQQQALAEGYAGGPTPTLNSPNLNTQASIGNPLIPVIEPTPYFPPTISTPNLGLSLNGMDDVLAQDMVILDTAIAGGGFGPITSGSLQAVNATTPLSLSVTAALTVLYAISVSLESTGTAASGHVVIVSLSWTSPLTPHNISLTLPLDSRQLVMETYPILCQAETPINIATVYAGGATDDPYTISLRIVEIQ